MNDYIINPAWFYWVSVADDVQTAVVILAVLLGVAIAATAIGYVVSYDGLGKAESIKVKKILKRLAIALAICALIVVFLPSRDTLIEMQIAKFATYENAEWTLDAIKNAVDYIVNAIQTANGG